MGKVGFRFLIVFFSWFGALIVFINFVGWSGAYINLASGRSVDWTDSYFGFTSVQIMIKTLNKSINAIPYLTINKFTDHLNDFLDTCAFGLPNFLQTITTNGVDAWALVKMLVMILGGQPLVLIAQLFIVIAHILWYAVNFVAIITLAFGGTFNIPFENPITPGSIQYAIDSVRIPIPLMV